jgi:tRNA threonylcarbamoyladenosine biosynthesis protein TsaB
MRVLALDTTTPSGSVAVVENERPLGEIAVESATTHSSRLLSSIRHVLDALKLDIRDIDGFAVTPGPGSFTGIRIGMSTVKSFAFASQKPIAPVSSLLALAWKLRDSQPRLIAPLLDAKKGEIYAALFEFRSGKGTEAVRQGAYDPARFVSLIPADRVVLFIGNGLFLCRDLIAARCGDKARFPERSPFIAAEVGIIGRNVLAAGKGISSEKLEPLYFRKSQAEDSR